MTDLSREELRAHLSAVEAQVRAALRIIAAESKSVQQAHSALRADLSAALIRLQSEISEGQTQTEAKLDRAIADINSMRASRKSTSMILAVLVLIFGVTVGILAGGSWFFLQQSASHGASLEAPSQLSDERATDRSIDAQTAPSQAQPPDSDPSARDAARETEPPQGFIFQAQ
ncbi:MAG: hypothetical protein QNJ84_00450 [Alphaproteobacteria bacterium]|nr:hypothetical protein [Alphaproteobacteria bacterium]